MRRLWFGGIACLLALCAGIAHAEERVRVALLPMLVRSAEGRDYLQQGLSDMLVARLARDERLAIVPVEDPQTATADLAAAQKTAKANGADYVIYGTFTRFGEGASLELLCAPVREEVHEPRRIYVHAENMGALMPLLDGVAQRATYAVLGAPAEGGPAVSTGPSGETAPEKVEPMPHRVDEKDAKIGKREHRAPGLPSDTAGDVLR